MFIIDWITNLTWKTLPFVHYPGNIIPVLALVFYFGFVLYLLPLYFKTRKPLNVQNVLPYWNLFLFLGSSMGAATYLYIMLLRHWGSSLYDIICDPNQQGYDGINGLMAYLFLVSKFVEFGDTIFTVVKKRPVPFIHWYHHATVMSFTWISVVNRNSIGQWFGLINACVHTLMYYYYWRTTSGQKIWWGKILTGLQLQQMVIGLLLLICWIYFWKTHDKCTSENPYVTVISGTLMYGSYIVLFAKFYYEKYIIMKDTKSE